jgi:hypothetical protein
MKRIIILLIAAAIAAYAYFKRQQRAEDVTVWREATSDTAR